MNARTVCYFGLTRNPERLQSILALLPDELKSDCERVIDELKQKEPAAWKAEWAAARVKERKVLTSRVEERLGGRVACLPEALRKHLLWRAAARI